MRAYTLTEKDVLVIRQMDISGIYPDNLKAARIEQELAKTLPIIDGLRADMSVGEETVCISLVVAAQFIAFVASCGDAFGQEPEFDCLVAVPVMQKRVVSSFAELTVNRPA